MSTRTKFILTYVAGIITGVVIVFAISFYTVMNFSEGETKNQAVQLFDSPKQEIKATSFKVIQVLPDGSTLATYDNIIPEKDAPEYGMVVMFQVSEENSYYDDQVISLPKGKCFKQVGTYRYTTQQDIVKTVPVIAIYDK